tara:strand:- start:9022 stop:10005 length:984 start_codon:yes stop_codon:yes gene_type:complete
MKENYSRKICVAPMMGYTTPYARNLYRILSKETFLFTEMIASKSLIHSKKRNLIVENNNHNPVALQVGGSELIDLSKCSKIAYEYNYDEINLNVGCPSKAVQKGSFGACLMKEKNLVRQCLEAMQTSKIKVTMKCRIGIGTDLNYDFFEEFIDEVAKSEIKTIYVHARNAILSGISPKANRNIPPLNYEFVKKIKQKFPNISFILNGGIDSFDKLISLEKNYDGLMIGRLILNNPFILKDIDKLIFNKNNATINYEEIINDYFQLIKNKVESESIFRLLSPLLNIFFGVPNSKSLKSEINQNMKNHKLDVIEKLFLKFIKQNKFLIQ